MQRKEVEAILVIVIGMIGLHFIFGSVWFLRIGFGVGIVSLVAPSIGKLIVKGWFKLAEGLGWVNSRILLSAIFLLFLTPIAWLSKLSRKRNSLQLKNNANTLWVERNKTYKKEDLEKMW